MLVAIASKRITEAQEDATNKVWQTAWIYSSLEQAQQSFSTNNE